MLNLVATALLGHALIIAAYMIHECAHNTVFKRNADNARLGAALTWICGASYGTYEDIRYKHFRHHVDNDDICWYALRDFGERFPNTIGVVKFLEWFYIPAHDLLQHSMMAVMPFLIPERHDQRLRTVVVTVIRVGLFALLVALSLKAAILYLVAYMMMLHVLRFMDGLQHDYGANPIMYLDVDIPRRGDTVWEQAHTFSNMHSLRHRWLNCFTLNFGYHNAHHDRPTTPWYRLPALHCELFDDDPACSIGLPPQLVMYHRSRVSRVASSHVESEPDGIEFLHAAQRAGVSGGNGASFLCSF